MSYCTCCGAQVESGDQFCSRCGHPVESQTAGVKKSVRRRKGIPNILYIIVPLAIVGVISTVLALGVPWRDPEVSAELTIADETQASEFVLGDGTAAIIPPGSLTAGAT